MRAAAVLVANLVLMELLTPPLGLAVAKVLTEAGPFLVGYAVQSRLVFAVPVSVPILAPVSTTATTVQPASARAQAQWGRGSRRLR